MAKAKKPQQPKTTSFRLDDDTKEMLKELSLFLKESQKDVLDRAIKMLYNSREEVLKAETISRLDSLKSKEVK